MTGRWAGLAVDGEVKALSEKILEHEAKLRDGYGGLRQGEAGGCVLDAGSIAPLTVGGKGGRHDGGDVEGGLGGARHGDGGCGEEQGQIEADAHGAILSNGRC